MFDYLFPFLGASFLRTCPFQCILHLAPTIQLWHTFVRNILRARMELKLNSLVRLPSHLGIIPIGALNLLFFGQSSHIVLVELVI